MNTAIVITIIIFLKCDFPFYFKLQLQMTIAST